MVHGKSRDYRRYLAFLSMVVILALATGFFLTGFNVMAYETSNVVVFNVFVPGICYIDIGTANIVFGILPPGTNTLTNFQLTVNDIGGNSASNVFVNGDATDLIGGATGQQAGNWVATSGTGNFYVSNTLWNPTSLNSYTGYPLTFVQHDTYVFLPAPTVSTPTTTNYVYFGLAVPGGAPAATYDQNIIVATSC